MEDLKKQNTTMEILLQEIVDEFRKLEIDIKRRNYGIAEDRTREAVHKIRNTMESCGVHVYTNSILCY